MLNYITTRVKHCKYICTNYSHRFQQNMLNFLLGANRPGAKRLWGGNDQGRNAAGAKRLGGELDLVRNDPDSTGCPLCRESHPLCRLKNPTVISIWLLVGFHPATRSVQCTHADYARKRAPGSMLFTRRFVHVKFQV